jgi:hypothetical protein
MEVTMILPYNKDMNIVNLEALARGTGARYLECIEGLQTRPGAAVTTRIYVAKQWRRKIPKEYAILIDFKPGT